MTYSILARDPQTGHMGAAIQSHWFGVGRETLWSAGAAQGFVVCQAFVEPAYGPGGLQALQAKGLTPPAALAALRADDPGQAARQVAVMNQHGELACYTGAECLAHAEHVTDHEGQVSCQANLMLSEGVPQAMLKAYRANLDKPLERRLLAALYAAQALGGDLRGQQSAAMLISAPEDPPGSHWVDLRVDDSTSALAELKRLLDKWGAYQTLQKLQACHQESERQALHARLSAQTSNPEILFWADVALHSHPRSPIAYPAPFDELARRLG